MTSLETFIWGFGGSAAVEIVELYKHSKSNENRFPDRYYRFGFWVVRFFLAVVAGGLAVAYGVEKAIVAANIGAATPLIIQTLAEGYDHQTKPSLATERNPTASEIPQQDG